MRSCRVGSSRSADCTARAQFAASTALGKIGFGEPRDIIATMRDPKVLERLDVEGTSLNIRLALDPESVVVALDD